MDGPVFGVKYLETAALVGFFVALLALERALPLRRPRPGEHASSWACSYCDSRYRAVLDDSCPAEITHNARLADSG